MELTTYVIIVLSVLLGLAILWIIHLSITLKQERASDVLPVTGVASLFAKNGNAFPIPTFKSVNKSEFQPSKTRGQNE